MDDGKNDVGLPSADLRRHCRTVMGNPRLISSEKLLGRLPVGQKLGRRRGGEKAAIRTDGERNDLVFRRIERLGDRSGGDDRNFALDRLAAEKNDDAKPAHQVTTRTSSTAAACRSRSSVWGVGGESTAMTAAARSPAPRASEKFAILTPPSPRIVPT